MQYFVLGMSWQIIHRDALITDIEFQIPNYEVYCSGKVYITEETTAFNVIILGEK